MKNVRRKVRNIVNYLMGKAVSFQPPLAHIRMGLGTGTLPYQEIKNPHSPCLAYHLGWEYTYFRLNDYCFVTA